MHELANPKFHHRHVQEGLGLIPVPCILKMKLATSEDDLQTMAYHLKLIAREYKMTISSTKTKSMAMWGNHIQRVKIVINDNPKFKRHESVALPASLW